MPNLTPQQFKKAINEFLSDPSQGLKASAPQPPNLDARIDVLCERISDMSLPPLKKLELIYEFWDVSTRFYKKYASCKKGCSACCYFDVQITEIEAQHITFKTGKKHTQPSQALLTGHTKACPFLEKNGACGVYFARPLACRSLHAFGPSHLCESESENQISIGHAWTQNPNDPLLISLRLIDSYISPVSSSKDIRQYFPYRNKSL